MVVQLTSIFCSDTSRLTTAERQRYRTAFADATRDLEDFRRDVLLALRDYYGAGTASEGNKCFKVARSGRRLPADVLVAQTYRVWSYFTESGLQGYIEGIIFRTRDGRDVVNYPKQHRSNGEKKHADTGDRYKPIVRTVKNARRKIVDDGVLTKDDAPSYFVECLWYNVPNSEFTGDLDMTYPNTLVWLGQHVDSMADALCQNGITKLFGREPEQWDLLRAGRLISALLSQWLEWDK